MLNETNQTLEMTFSIFYLHKLSRIVWIFWQNTDWELPDNRVRGYNKYRVLFGSDEHILELGRSGSTTVQYYYCTKCHLFVHFKSLNLHYVIFT